MNRSLRTELLVSHLALIGLMLLLVLASVIGFFRLGRSVDRILRDNYKSVVAAQNMKESLERQDSAATFYLAGEAARARRDYEASAPGFEQAYIVESGNITENGEQEITNEIKVHYGLYRTHIQQLIYANPALSPARANTFYFRTLEPEFLYLKHLAQRILDINQSAIVRANNEAKAEAGGEKRME